MTTVIRQTYLKAHIDFDQAKKVFDEAQILFNEALEAVTAYNDLLAAAKEALRIMNVRGIQVGIIDVIADLETAINKVERLEK